MPHHSPPRSFALPDSPKEPPPPPRPVSPIETLNTLPEDEFRVRFFQDRHTSCLCCNKKTESEKRRCPNNQPAGKLLIALDPPPNDISEKDESRGDRVALGNIDVSHTLPANYLLRFTTALGISKQDLEACFRLVERTSSADYKASSVGWSPATKREEMADGDMKYLLLTACDSGHNSVEYRIYGFLSFMLTREDNLPVIYCYEIHLRPGLQGRGIGKRLMGIMENIGRKVGVRKTMLTVFSRNEGGRRWYQRIGYKVDESSPTPKRLRGGKIKEPSYFILSKELGKNLSEEGSKGLSDSQACRARDYECE